MTEAGRTVRLTPVPRGFWLVVLGGAVAVLAPLFGFLIAGVGLAAAALGVRRIVSDRAQAPS
ncbi:MAG TPA: hypothetical protein VFU85_06590 [Nocardioides sp.]|nr:hypothetical protein [Nocardioides sp.]